MAPPASELEPQVHPRRQHRGREDRERDAGVFLQSRGEVDGWPDKVLKTLRATASQTRAKETAPRGKVPGVRSSRSFRPAMGGPRNLPPMAMSRRRVSAAYFHEVAVEHLPLNRNGGAHPFQTTRLCAHFCRPGFDQRLPDLILATVKFRVESGEVLAIGPIPQLALSHLPAKFVETLAGEVVGRRDLVWAKQEPNFRNEGDRQRRTTGQGTPSAPALVPNEPGRVIDRIGTLAGGQFTPQDSVEVLSYRLLLPLLDRARNAPRSHKPAEPLVAERPG